MSLNVGAAMDQVRREAANRLLRAAAYFVAQHQQLVGVSNPRPHKTPSRTGEYPRKRTGEGQAAIVYGPTSPDDIAQELKVRMGLLPSGKHMAILEFWDKMQRLGFLKTAADLESQIKALLS